MPHPLARTLLLPWRLRQPQGGDKMASIWKSTTTATKTNNTFTGTVLSSWSRQQKLAMIAGFAILAIVLAVSACSKQSAKSTLVAVSNPAPTNQTASPTTPVATFQALATPPAIPAAKKTTTSKKRPANVLYTDANSGVSFMYPRKSNLTTGGKAQPYFDSDAVPMNFVHDGGTALATVELPNTLYPGTDFANAFFTVNVNRTIPQNECQHFAYLDMSEADGEPIESEKVTVGSTEMQRTSEFAGNALRQAEARYYHNYENGACYEYVLGLGTAGYGTKDGVKPVDRDEVFSRLEKILATVKIQPVAHDRIAPDRIVHEDEAAKAQPADQQLTTQAVAGSDSGK